MTVNKQLGRAMILYAIGTFLQRIGAFILVPLYTSVLLIAEYGALETVTVTYQVFMILINFGLSNALIRFYHECRDDSEVFLMIRTSWVSVTGISILLYIAVSPFFPAISSFLLKENQPTGLVTLSFFWAVGGALNQQFFGFYRARQDARTYIILSIVYFILSTSLNIFFVRVLNLKVTGVLYGNMAVVWGINLIAFIKFFGRERSLSLEWTKKLFSFGFPLLFGIISWVILNSADRFFLAYYRDLSEVAVYGLGYKVGLIAQIAVVTPFQLAWAPYMFRKSASSTENIREEFSRVLTWLLTGFSMVGMGIFLFSKEIIHLFGSGKFPQAADVIPYILVSYIFAGVFYWAGSFLNLTNKTIVYSMILLTMAALNLLLNWLWIPAFGWHGAAWATMLCVGGVGLLTLIAGERAYPVKLETVRLLKLFIIMGVIILARYLSFNVLQLSGIILSTALLLSAPALLYFANFFTPKEKKYIRNLPGIIKDLLRTMVSPILDFYPSVPGSRWKNRLKKGTRKIQKWLKPVSTSEEYWMDRYKSGGNSGPGSYDDLARFKADLLNKFVQTENIQSIIEYGCGDGNQLSLSRYPSYIGFDISPEAIRLCREKFRKDNSKTFNLMKDYSNETAELTISLDVIYHLLEDPIFFQYMHRLFNSSERFVIIYSSNTENQVKGQASHIRHRDISIWIREHQPHWELFKFIPNKYPQTVFGQKGSFADFYIYKKTCSRQPDLKENNHTK